MNKFYFSPRLNAKTCGSHMEEKIMQSVCKKAFRGLFKQARSAAMKQEEKNPMAKHEKCLSVQIFCGGVAVSALLISAIYIFGGVA
ncbi:MAG: hypothetical protein DELT_02322 [Desulfovibrio sp.]